MGKFIDITGQKFGRLTALDHTRLDGRKEIYWRCTCECGGSKYVMSQNLRTGKIQSCGCLLRETTGKRRRTHGQSRSVPGGKASPEYRAWTAMRERCNYPKAVGYKNYGGRGITVCAEWQEDFQAFFDHIGPRPSPKHSVDRVDNEGHYEPGNVRWATRAEQARNTRAYKNKHNT